MDRTFDGPSAADLPVRRHLFSLPLKLAGTLIAVVCFALGLATLLNVLRYQEVLEQLVEQRLEVVAQGVVGDIQFGLDLGLLLEAMDNLPALVARPLAQGGGVGAVTLRECNGKALVHAAQDGAPAGDPGVMLAAGERRAWRFDRQGIALALMLDNGFGQCAGVVELRYDPDAFFAHRDTVVAQLIGKALLAALWLLPALAILGLGFRLRDRSLRRIRGELDALSGGGEQWLRPDDLAGSDNQRALMQAYVEARPVLFDIAHRPLPDTALQAVPEGVRHRLGRWLKDPVFGVLALTGVTTLLALLMVTSFTAQVFKDTLRPELALKGLAESAQLARVVQWGLDLAVPLDKLVGVDELYASQRRYDGDASFLVIEGGDGRPAHVAGLSPAEVENVLKAPASPLDDLPGAGQAIRAGHLVSAQTLHDADGRQVATLRLGHDEAALSRPVEESVADLSIVLLVSLFLAFESMLLVVTLNLTLPLRGTLKVLGDIAARRFASLHGEIVGGELGAIARRLNGLVAAAATRLGVHPRPIQDPRLIGVRLLAFLFVFAEEVARPIMPVYFGGIAADGGGLGAGAVMALHLAVVAAGMPLCSMLYDRIGRRRMYAGGALLASVGLVGTAIAGDVWQLLPWRALSALGYAATFVACQGFVIESTHSGNRATGTAMMVGGIMLADICGPAIGGILAAWLPHESIFMLGGGIAAVAALSVTGLMGRIADHADRPPRITLRGFIDTLDNRHLWALLLFAAVPAKLILSGLLYYLVPLALTEQGASAAQTGRILMLYGLIGLLAGPLLGRAIDRLQKPLLALAMGGALSAAGALPLLFGASQGAIALAVFALGLGQALSIPAQFTSALALTRTAVETHGQGPVMAVMRLLERLGGAIGPLAAALLAGAFGVTTAMGAFGVYSLLCAVALPLALRGRRGEAG